MLLAVEMLSALLKAVTISGNNCFTSLWVLLDDLRQFISCLLKSSCDLPHSPASSYCSYRLLWTTTIALQSPWWTDFSHSSARKKDIIKIAKCFSARWVSYIISLCLSTVRVLLEWLKKIIYIYLAKRRHEKWSHVQSVCWKGKYK